MCYASRSGRASTNASNPQAHAICDRCGFRYNHVNLKWQYDWRCPICGARKTSFVPYREPELLAVA